MSSFEFNKVFAAILVAAITAMLGGFVAKQLVHPHDLEKDAVEIEGAPLASSGPAVIAKPDPILQLIAAADITKGEKISKACTACHSFDKGGPHKVGPNLNAIVGAPKGLKGGFEYSSALREAGGAWGYEELNGFLWKPKKHLPGTKMNYIGLKKPQDRANLIAWLRQQGSASFPLPNDAEIAAEAAAFAPPEATEESADGDEGGADKEADAGDEGAAEAN